MPVRIVENFTLAHECSQYDLKWGDGVEVEYGRAKENDWPFITHINEGWDEEAKRGISYLVAKNALTENTVLIHGLSYSMEDIHNIAKFRANHVWCPISNYYMFEKVAKVKEMRELGINVAIGTDSPMSGGVNILEEMRFGKRIYKEIYNEELEDKAVCEMVTINGAKAFRIDKFTGSIEPGKNADLLVLKDEGEDPYTTLVQAKLEDILIVIYNGEPVYADETFESLFKTLKIPYKRVNINKARKIVKYGENYPDINEIMNRVKANVGYEKRLPFVPIG
jgi:cytosine/adenosine deaminase-related metal-dependent hydrolase